MSKTQDTGHRTHDTRTAGFGQAHPRAGPDVLGREKRSRIACLALLHTVVAAGALAIIAAVVSRHVAQLDAAGRQGRAEVVELVQLVHILILGTNNTDNTKGFKMGAGVC
jgi:hypothetical protein